MTVADFELDDAGELQLRKVISPKELAEESAIFQPEFSPDGRHLSFISDQDGWFNLRVLDLQTGEISARFGDQAEHAPMAWVHGLRSHAWSPDSKRIYLIRNSLATCDLVRYELGSGKIEPAIEEPQTQAYTCLRQPAVHSSKGTIALIASGTGTPPEVALVNPAGRVIRKSRPHLLPLEYCRQPEPLEWRSLRGGPCYGLYSAPSNPDYGSRERPPVIVKVHGGPTSQYSVEYDADTLFFTSRGFGVLALNYQGSSGYGRDYRARLDGRWGELDVEDARSAYEYLVETGRADSSRVALSGGSAGGLTVLLALARYPGLFAAAICRYGVTDLRALLEETHRFEAGYLHSLIGSPESYPERYRERSPVFCAEQIVDPVALFQGSEDRVVPPAQSESIAESLKQRGIPHIYKVYEGEGHGWRKKETVVDYYLAAENFLLEHVVKPAGRG